MHFGSSSSSGLGLIIIFVALLAMSLWILRGSRPMRRGRPLKARSFRFLRQYRPVGMVSEVAVVVPLGWGVARVVELVHGGLVLVVLAAASVAAASRFLGGVLETVVGCLGLAAAVVTLPISTSTMLLQLMVSFASAIIAAGTLLLIGRIRLTTLPLVVLMLFELVTLTIELGGPASSMAEVPSKMVPIMVAVVLLAVATRIVLALLGVAVVAGFLAAASIAPAVHGELALLGLAAAVVAASVAFVLPRRDALPAVVQHRGR